MSPASDWSNDRRDHKWKISDIGTFGANIGVALYQCHEDGGHEPSGIYNLILSGYELMYVSDLKVMLLHNEHVVKEQPACGEELCTVQDFKRKYQHIVDLDFDRECSVGGTHTDHEYEEEWNSGAEVIEENEVSSEDEDDSDEDSDSNSDEDSSSEEDY